MFSWKYENLGFREVFWNWGLRTRVCCTLSLCGASFWLIRMFSYMIVDDVKGDK